MANEEDKNLEEIAKEILSNPASGSVDGQSFTSHRLTDLIEWDKYQRSKKVSQSNKLGFKIHKLQGGSVND